ncbi:MAG TPA: hypothetical protein VFD70_18430 [Anaerolineae bacterium]|nr:hypothetical protein [Anaerolineae bacterium]
MPAKKTSRKAMKTTTKGKAKKTTRAPKKQQQEMPEVEGHSMTVNSATGAVPAPKGAKP